MNLLFSNDHQGTYPPSWYSATTQHLPEFPAVEGDVHTDVCVIGAGYTGLSAALHLAQQGVSVRVLDAHRVGFGASGRNGGQLGMGQRMDQRDLINLVGDTRADHLWDMGLAAQDLVKSLIREHNIDCHIKPGVAYLGHTSSDANDLRRYCDFLHTRYQADWIEPLSQSQGYELVPTHAYHGGLIDHHSAHLHPLAFALGLARAAEHSGAIIHERSLVTGITQGKTPQVITDRGRVSCQHVIIACNGYLGELDKKTAARVMPINNFIAATEPLGRAAARVLTQDIAVADSKFVVNYFRLSHDGRLLFGGGENYSYRFPTDIAAKVRKPMTEIFPHLRDVRIDYAWGGTLGITARRMPFFERRGQNIWIAAGYSGHGLGTATQAGQLIAQAIHGDASGFNAMASIPALPFAGGRFTRWPLLVMAMTWYALRDRLGA